MKSLGSRTTTNSPVPQAVMGPWVNALKSFQYQNDFSIFFPNVQAFDITDKTDQKRMYVKRLFSGGDHSFAFATPNNSESYDDRAVEYVLLSNSYQISLACLNYK